MEAAAERLDDLPNLTPLLCGMQSDVVSPEGVEKLRALVPKNSSS